MVVQRINPESTSLRERIIAGASKLLVEEGYENLSMRRVAQAVGCSQMAMYRHFANKEALTQYLCAQLYIGFTEKIYRAMQTKEQPWERLRIFIASLLQFAVSYPDHYSLIFLVRHSDPAVIEERERLGQQFLKDIRAIVKELLPPTATKTNLDLLLRQLLCCLHGTAALLIAHPKAYGLTQQRAIKDAELTFRRLLEQSI